MHIAAFTHFVMYFSLTNYQKCLQTMKNCHFVCTKRFESNKLEVDREYHFWRPGFIHITICAFLGYNVSNFVKKLDVTDV